jgi:hypothetical protein
LRRRDLPDEKKYRNIADQKKEKMATDGIVYGMKGINDGQDKKDYEGERKANALDLQNPLCYPSIEPDKDGPPKEDHV